jgi:hypothetical protein
VAGLVHNGIKSTDEPMKLRFSFFLFACMLASVSFAQVNAVEFGKNRIQHKKFTWRFYETPNFYTYFNIGGNELAKYAAQVGEQELQQIEQAVEYSLQRKANIIIYNNYEDYKSSNIGLGTEMQNPGGITKLVNNKIVVYFNGNHADLRRQIRQGIVKALVENQLFGDDIGEFASNQALLDLPKWLVEGYIRYHAENWNAQLDDRLKDAMMSGDYKNFYQFAFKEPELAGHAFWYYLGDKYKKDNVTYFLYLARIYKSLNTASLRITKKKFKPLLAEFMSSMEDRYFKDIRQRRNAPKGNIAVVEDVEKHDLFRFQVNPNRRNNTYAAVKYKKGIYSVILNQQSEETVLLKYGVRVLEGSVNPNYPILAWDGKGTRLLVIYWQEGKLNMFVYDLIARIKRDRQEIKGFDQILDAGFMLNPTTLLMSAVKNGQTDIFTYNTQNQKVEQITNDVYDDLDPTFVSFPNRSAIIFASNRPSGNAMNADTALPSRNPFNIYLADIFNKSDFRQLTKLTNLKFGDARFPMQYNMTHFTFVSNENGISNRWAGFFTTQNDGLDTLFYVGDEILRNPSDADLDSTLLAWQKKEPDSVSYFRTYKDSSYSFPITNYQSSLLETRIAGDNGQVSEIRKEGDLKFVYKLKIDSIALRKRNVNARPTEYMKQRMAEDRASRGKATTYQATDSTKKKVFQSEFDDKDTSGVAVKEAADERPNVLSKARLFNYKLKFSADYLLSGVSNNILMNRYQPYGGGTGPIKLNNGTTVNWNFRVGISDLMEDYKLVGGIRFGTNLKDRDYLLSFQNFRKRVDWGVTYFRSTNTNFKGAIYSTPTIDYNAYNTKLITSLYQVNVAYPFNEIKRLQLTAGIRSDRGIVRSAKNDGSGSLSPDVLGLGRKDSTLKYVVSRLEYVFDNTLNPTQNIWFGLRWKLYFDANVQTNKNSANKAVYTFNAGFDARYYVPIVRNFIWAFRGAGDFSWGNQKIIYYLGGVDGWLNPQFNNNIKPAADVPYAFQSLAVNMRGFPQNVANGNNAIVLNSEFRLPVFTTIFNKPINNAFLRNFQLIQFTDLGTAWNGKFSNIERPSTVYTNGPITLRYKAGGIGPFVGGYGFGARSTLLGYFLKADASWEMNGIFKGKPYWYFAMGFDF